MYIPANTNHQWLVEPGDELLYLVVNLPTSTAPHAAVLHPATTVPQGTLDPVEDKVSEFVDYGERRGIVVRRGGTSKAETHDDHGHAMMLMHGEGTVILGGTVIDASGKPAKANDVGTTITDGVEYRLKAGDALSFPANTNHQYVGTPGAPFIYFTLND
jgi:quercetin dioxygenase-like cupin family protein